ncbi:MAG TPA: SDR family oxidoreductase [Syntrophorhabdaceae bacterium]|nr:SDR family oxidoreductase [Syntrophorhabdaceae bacterium]HQM82266.1 SDR family oxidoreductase [Syntrophorhabdaceae bacterium]
MRLSNKVALITGAGSGMGQASALLFAEEGAKAAVVDINGKAAQQTVNLIKEKGGDAVSIEGDVSKANDVAGMIKATMDAFGRLDILFNNAGYPMVPTPLIDVEEELWDKIMDVNVKGIFLACKYAVPIMRQQGGGVIINTASISGVRPRPGQSPYAASKAAAILLTKALAVEFAPYKIRVNCINPTATETPMLPLLGTTEESKKVIISTIPLGRMALPKDIAYAALYLASDESAMVTGTALNVDGGRGV